MCRRKAILLPLVIVGVLLVLSCRRIRHDEGLPSIGSSTEPSFVSDAVTYCRDDRSNPVPARVQVLLDSSGSMVGYTNLIPELVNWMQHSLSLLRASSVEISEGRICQFSSRFDDGTGAFPGQCASNITQPFQGFVAESNTNLHRAIQSAERYDLTLILTDGVAATGAGGSGDCASGVDAACIARALRSVITSHAQELEGHEDWGLWIIPLVAPYDGKFFTEQRLSAQTFDSKIAQEHIRSDTGSDSTITGAKTLATTGELYFETYRGPRAMLLIVLARFTNLGRAAVQVLSERMEYLGIRSIESLNGFKGSTSALPALELFPGLVDHVEWRSLTASSTVPSVGTIDASLIPGGRKDSTASLRINCPPNGSGEGYFSLSGEIPRVTQVAGCVEIRLLPAISFRLEPRSKNDDEALATFISGYQRTQPGNYSSLDLQLTCGPQTTRTCESPVEVDWRAYMHYEKAADCLADPQCSAATPQLLQNLSTTQPNEYPHRIYGMSETLEEFFRLSAADVKSHLMANLSVCREAK